MRVRYAVTFEFDTQPPLTHRGIVAGFKTPTVVKRALKDAMTAHPGVTWSSMVIVLLERLPEIAEVEHVELSAGAVSG